MSRRDIFVWLGLILLALCVVILTPYLADKLAPPTTQSSNDYWVTHHTLPTYPNLTSTPVPLNYGNTYITHDTVDQVENFYNNAYHAQKQGWSGGRCQRSADPHTLQLCYYKDFTEIWVAIDKTTAGDTSFYVRDYEN